MNKDLIRGIAVGGALFGLGLIMFMYVVPRLPLKQEQTQSRQWTAPMQQWLGAGNRLVVDYVAVDGWCAVAIQRPIPEDAPEGTATKVECIR